jgi:hypothetical protein
MTPAVKSAVFALDLEQTRRHLHRSLVSVKEPSAQSEELLKVGMDLLPRGQIAKEARRCDYQRVAIADPDHRFKITEMGVQSDPHSLRAWISCITQDGKSLLLETDRVELQKMYQEIQRQLNR